MYVHSEKSAKFTASKTYPFTRVGKLKAIVDLGWEPGVMEYGLVACAVSTKVCLVEREYWYRNTKWFNSLEDEIIIFAWPSEYYNTLQWPMSAQSRKNDSENGFWRVLSTCFQYYFRQSVQSHICHCWGFDYLGHTLVLSNWTNQ